MRNTTSLFTGGILLIFLGLAAFPVSVVRAAPIAEINFSNVPGVITGFPTVMASDSQVCCGSGEASASVPLGTLRAQLTAQSPFALPGGSDSYSIRVAIHDEFPWSFGPLGTHFPLLVSLTVTGTGLAPLLDEETSAPGGQSFGFVRAIVGSGTAETFSFTTSTPRAGEVQVAPDVPFPISLTATDVIDAVSGSSFLLTYTLIIQGANETALDVFHSAQLSFDLPPGASISSVGGFVQQATPVPEPSAFVITGLAAFGLLGWRRRHSARYSRVASQMSASFTTTLKHSSRSF